MIMLPADLLGVVFGLISSAVWGSADFSGGLASRRNSQFQVLVLSSSAGVVLLIGCAILWGEHFPSPAGLIWSALAGIAGALGLAVFYRALSLGYTTLVAPTAAVVGAILPVLIGILTEGFPGTTQIAGFAVAILGIWLVSRSTAPDGVSRQALGLALLSGVGFGAFFAFMGQVQQDVVFTPLLVAKIIALATALVLLISNRMKPLHPAANPIALLAGVLDVGGNIFYLLARHATRLDVAVVLSSLYPAATVILARIVLKEKATRSQWLGAALCLAAVVLIAM